MMLGQETPIMIPADCYVLRTLTLPGIVIEMRTSICRHDNILPRYIITKGGAAYESYFKCIPQCL